MVDKKAVRIQTSILNGLEKKALESGFNQLILQTREIMTGAVRLYIKLGYHCIQNYPPYDNLDGAICFAKEL